MRKQFLNTIAYLSVSVLLHRLHPGPDLCVSVLGQEREEPGEGLERLLQALPGRR